jgi:hypothetical protein
MPPPTDIPEFPRPLSPTKTVDEKDQHQSTPDAAPLMEGESNVPNFDALYRAALPSWEQVKKQDLNGMRARLEALAETRPLLRAAQGEHEAEFRRFVKSRYALRGNGRVETLVVKMFFRDTTKGDTNINRAGDVLTFITFRNCREEGGPDLSTALTPEVVDWVLSEGYTKVAKRQRDFRAFEQKPTEKPPLIVMAEDYTEDCVPLDADTLFQKVPVDAEPEVGLLIYIKRPGALLALHGPITDDPFVRRALTLCRAS